MFFKRQASASFADRRFKSAAATGRRLAASALLAAAMGVTAPGLLYAQDLPGPTDTTVALQDPSTMSNADKLKLGVDQYRRGQYEESLATLTQVDVSKLAPDSQKILNETLAKAEASANERKAARAEFERGEQALNTGNPLEAIVHYRNAADNKFADEGTRAKAREQIAVAEGQMKASGQSLKDVYAQAVADYKAGSYAEARTKFVQLQEAGFKAPMFQRTPGDYLKDIDRRLAAGQQPSGQQQPLPEPLPEPAPVETTRQPAPQPEPVAQQPAPQPEPVAQQPAPQPEPAPITVSTEQPVVTTPPPVQPPVEQPLVQPEPIAVPPPEATQQPVPAPQEALPATVSKEEAKAAYRQGRQQFRDGDLAGARRSFEIAERGGYRPGLFEDSPAKYLSRIDRQEQALAAKAAQQGAAAARTDAMIDTTADAERMRLEQNKAEAQNLVVQAEQARAANRVDEALALYTRAADLDPTNDLATTGKAELLRITGRDASPPSALDRQEQVVQQSRQYIDYSIKTALEEASQATAAGRYTEARAALTRAQNARDTNPGVFTQAELTAYDTSIANARVSIDTAEDKARIAEATAAQQDATRQINLDEQAAMVERQRTVSDRIREARNLVDQGKYEAAVGVIDQILVLDPNNDYAIGVRPLVEDAMLFQQQRRARERYDREFTKVLNRGEEQRIPYNDVLMYPANWPDLTAVRERSVALERGEQAEDQSVQAQLDRKLPEVRLEASAFSDVVDFLRDISGANIFVNWRALEGVGIDRTTPVTARLRDVKFAKVLRTILDDVGAGNVRLGYTIDEGVITISTEEDLANNVVTRVYDIRDLIINVPDFDNAPDFSLQGSSAGGQGGGGNLFGGNVNNQQQQGALTRSELVDAIIRLIQDTVSSDSWKDNGGSIGSIRELAGQLIVTQTPENQRELIRLLEQLRETRAIQVTVEARFLVVQRNFLEDVGVDFDAVFNINGDNNFSAIPVVQNSFDFNDDLGALDTAIPGNLGTEYAARQLAPSLTTGFTFLDDFQVSLLIRATQAAQSSSTLTAPRVTLFNGQRAFVLVATETAYVSDLTPIVGTNAVAFDPQPGVVQSGVLLDVVATVSSDRKYVTLTLRPTLSRLRDLVQFPVTALTAGGGDDGGVPISQTAFLQQPVRDITTVRTTVSVPDGGTLMIGGQTLNGEIERESGVPILSKIPFIKRLFTNRSTAKDDQILLILIRPTIIIQREREAEQFPTLNSNN